MVATACTTQFLLISVWWSGYSITYIRIFIYVCDGTLVSPPHLAAPTVRVDYNLQKTKLLFFTLLIPIDNIRYIYIYILFQLKVENGGFFLFP